MRHVKAQFAQMHQCRFANSIVRDACHILHIVAKHGKAHRYVSLRPAIVGIERSVLKQSLSAMLGQTQHKFAKSQYLHLTRFFISVF